MNIYNKIQDEMNRTLSTAATAGLAILLLVGCSSAPATPATPAAKLPVALTTTEAPTPAPTATSSDAAYLSTMNAIDPAKGDALLVAMAHTRCGDLDLGTTVDELEAKRSRYELGRSYQQDRDHGGNRELLPAARRPTAECAMTTATG